MHLEQQKTSNLFTGCSPDHSNMIPLLQKAQTEFGFLSLPVIEEIADYLKVTESQIYGVASFYSQFRFTQPAEHSVCVCLGTACHVQGGELLVETLERELGVKPGECTHDMKFEVQRVACLGCCALGPVVKIDHSIYSNMTVIKLQSMLGEYEQL